MNLSKSLFLVALITLNVLSVPVLLLPTSNPPEQVTYVANFEGPVKGTVKFYFVQDEKTKITVDVDGLSSEIVYSYHVHESPVAVPGDCASAGGHLDPTGKYNYAV